MNDGPASIQSRCESHLSYSACTDIGLKREENQDAFGVIEGEQVSVYLVADGMGGAQGGGVASSLAVEVFKNSLNDSTIIDRDVLCGAVKAANAAVFEKSMTDPSLAGMGTTLVALAFHGRRLHVVHVGDSRAYRCRGGIVTRLTEDHTLVQELVKAGTITLDQARNHPVAHMLTRSLGPGAVLEPEYRLLFDGPYKGDRYLLCSDGLYNLVNESEMAAILSAETLDAAVRRLVELANSRGGTDNITAIALEVGEGYPDCLSAEAASADAAAESTPQKSQESPTELSVDAQALKDALDRPMNGVDGNHQAFERHVSMESLREALRAQRREQDLKSQDEAQRAFQAKRIGGTPDEASSTRPKPEISFATRSISPIIRWIEGKGRFSKEAREGLCPGSGE